MIKSLSAFGSEILYGRVFLESFELLKSNVWFNVGFSLKVFDLKVSPIKYGNCGFPDTGFIDA